MIHIQCELLCNSDSSPAIRLAENSCWESQLKTDHPRRQRAFSHCKAKSKFMAQDAMKRASHTPDSPDLAPPDFYLFGQVKQLLSGYEFVDRDSLVPAVSDIFEAVKQSP
jgi:hypothetical protein